MKSLLPDSSYSFPGLPKPQDSAIIEVRWKDPPKQLTLDFWPMLLSGNSYKIYVSNLIQLFSNFYCTFKIKYTKQFLTICKLKIELKTNIVQLLNIILTLKLLLSSATHFQFYTSNLLKNETFKIIVILTKPLYSKFIPTLAVI